MNNRVAITQIGLCTPLGQTPEQVLARLIAGDTSAMQTSDSLLFGQSTLVAPVTESLPTIPAALTQFDCRNNQLLLAAALQITDTVELAKQTYGADRIGVVLGTSTSGIAKGELALAYRNQHGHFPADYHYFQQELGSTSDFLRQLFELQGPSYTISTACSSSAKVFASAKRLLEAKLCDMVIVGGIDSLCQLTVNGFHALESVSKGHCNPFSANRDGINIGEGAALFTLTLATDNTANEACVLLAGIGESSDAHHMSAPHPEGAGAIAAMKAALRDAQISAQDIDYINLHGTATPKNDAMESRAVLSVFGDTPPPASSTKPLVGHTLGAAGAIEAAFCYLLLSQHNHSFALPPHRFDGQQDPQDPSIALVAPMQCAEHGKLNYVMSNSFAFGGSNASLIFCRKGA
ncbi:beta-ketoacyl-[acyl-carrier-protein] synthase family protein [Shewanella oneidensis MR-1]|uniref:Beta-ketoacyl synthase n=1 Tax=Shewanella oneidensis (strain ATCC 700550 / JCM 31522 / CIP 106686 / LMG 19005 / NCIMB 14063 / MR-1) TaxID=211586 RepID=Q8E9A4_SHEON|nr:beta-ketoacyl-[acyl-carrier-protein] synthase family protein [Shewanella oneidensis]AAN57348.1 beta-ketoacyl synthase [Shewanella oneidensis MR-1]MDX5998346.1 beta-ketoacyl-[acyl-carrier-protein] synthase family protein [Shewanella oneidensis]MEE2027122.1 3-oxoacyl-[acyl-carrier-protein] synthase 2 [Shewanella oneidensis]QKG94684.1 beta-ketoacyl-[acyl-carrier-protein] synthase family protein [Shewanella oneidensis MR-1]